MKSKVTIEENETKIILIPQNRFEENVLQNASSENYSIVTKIKNRTDLHFTIPGERQMELTLSKNSGEVNLYPRLKERWMYQVELLRLIKSKLETVKGTKTINEVKALLEEWGNSPLEQF
jgi:hypothetical protein